MILEIKKESNTEELEIDSLEEILAEVHELDKVNLKLDKEVKSFVFNVESISSFIKDKVENVSPQSALLAAGYAKTVSSNEGIEFSEEDIKNNPKDVVTISTENMADNAEWLFNQIRKLLVKIGRLVMKFIRAIYNMFKLSDKTLKESMSQLEKINEDAHSVKDFTDERDIQYMSRLYAIDKALLSMESLNKKYTRLKSIDKDMVFTEDNLKK